MLIQRTGKTCRKEEKGKFYKNWDVVTSFLRFSNLQVRKFFEHKGFSKALKTFNNHKSTFEIGTRTQFHMLTYIALRRTKLHTAAHRTHKLHTDAREQALCTQLHTQLYGFPFLNSKVRETF